MNNIVKQNNQLANRFEGGISDEQFQLLTDTIMQGATTEELQFFVQVCNRTNLDPFLKQIHPVKRWNRDSKRYVWSFQVGIDGFRSIAQRTGSYAGSDDAIFDDESGKHPNKATVSVWKLVKGQRVSFTASARYSEYVQTKKDGAPNQMWYKMPFGQLAKCAEALALRKAFPEHLSGLHTDEEMGQADNIVNTQERSDELSPKLTPTKLPKKETSTVEVEIMPDLMPVPDDLNKHLNSWKEVEVNGDVLGSLKLASIHKLQDEVDSFDGEQKNAILASIIVEVRSILNKKGLSEQILAENKSLFPANLWDDPSIYNELKSLAKEL